MSTTSSTRALIASLAVVAAYGLFAQSEKPVTVIAYGDTRFTDPGNVTATSPLARAALIDRIIALAEFLKERSFSSRARFVVVAGHIHNYERFLQDDVVYLVSGGGGAVPYEVDRTATDLYKGIDFPNYHYVKLTIAAGRLTGEMYRLDEAAAPMPHFTRKDAFEVIARESRPVAAR